MATTPRSVPRTLIQALKSARSPCRKDALLNRSITTGAQQLRISPRRSHPKTLSSQCVRLHSRRAFSSSDICRLPTDGGGRTQHRIGVRIALRAGLFVGTGLILIAYFQYEKARLERKRIVEMSKGYGKPKVGGPFTLKDLDGNDYTHEDMKGKYAIIYFGFTQCPDICPDELDKLAAAIDILNVKCPNTFRPLFISVDPARDTPAVLKSYLAEFHPQIIGLTGSWQQIKDVCKQYRVYFSTPQNLKPGEEDYLVDHSIYFYVMDPEGDFVECIGRQDTPESAAAIILEHIKDWRKDGKPIDPAPVTYRNEVVRQTVQRRSSEVGDKVAAT